MMISRSNCQEPRRRILSKYLKLDLANEHPRRSVELYAEFGIAAEKAQVLEVAAGPGQTADGIHRPEKFAEDMFARVTLGHFGALQNCRMGRRLPSKSRCSMSLSPDSPGLRMLPALSCRVKRPTVRN